MRRWVWRSAGRRGTEPEMKQTIVYRTEAHHRLPAAGHGEATRDWARSGNAKRRFVWRSMAPPGTEFQTHSLARPSSVSQCQAVLGVARLRSVRRGCARRRGAELCAATLVAALLRNARKSQITLRGWAMRREDRYGGVLLGRTRQRYARLRVARSLSPSNDGQFFQLKLLARCSAAVPRMVRRSDALCGGALQSFARHGFHHLHGEALLSTAKRCHAPSCGAMRCDALHRKALRGFARHGKSTLLALAGHRQASLCSAQLCSSLLGSTRHGGNT